MQDVKSVPLITPNQSRCIRQRNKNITLNIIDNKLNIQDIIVISVNFLFIIEYIICNINCGIFSNNTFDNNLSFLNIAFCLLFKPILNIDNKNKFVLHISTAVNALPNIIDNKYKFCKYTSIHACTIFLVSIFITHFCIALCN